MRFTLKKLLVATVALGMGYYALGRLHLIHMPPAMAGWPTLYEHSNRTVYREGRIETRHPDLVPPAPIAGTLAPYPEISLPEDRPRTIAIARKMLSAEELGRFVDDFVQSGHVRDPFDGITSVKVRELAETPAGPVVRLRTLHTSFDCRGAYPTHYDARFHFRLDRTTRTLVCTADWIQL